MKDLEIFDAGVKSISDFGEDDLKPHFIYCGYHYHGNGEELKGIILTKMRKYGTQSSILTMLYMWRYNLVTKEKVKKAYKGELKNDEDWENEEGSINDDLERFFINLQNQKEVKHEDVWSFFTPKLTNEELKLVQEGNEEHLKSYVDHFYGKNPDVDVEEMKKSDSKSKYIHGFCRRITIPLTLDETDSETSFDSDETDDSSSETSWSDSS